MKRMVSTLTCGIAMLAALCPTSDASIISFVNNATGDFGGVIPDVSSTDLANGILPTFVHDPGTEVITNGTLADLTDGSIGTTSFGVNTGNGPGTAIYRIDLAAPEFIDSVNSYSSTNGTANNVRVDQNYVLYAALDPTAPSANLADLTDPRWTLIEEVIAVNNADATFGGTSVDLANGEFQSFVWAANPVSGAGGGESTIWKELDIIQGVNTIPEPSSAMLIGFAGISLLVRRRK